MISYLWLIFSNKIFMIILYIYNILNMNINLLLKINKNKYELRWIGMRVNVLIW